MRGSGKREAVRGYVFSLENISKRNEQEGATFGCSLAIFETANAR
jgi:hypothetical protein